MSTNNPNDDNSDGDRWGVYRSAFRGIAHDSGVALRGQIPIPKRTRHAVVSESIRRHIVAGLDLGLLVPGARLPSARELSAELRVHQRLVLAAYRLLQREGLVDIKPQSGVFVADRCPPVGGRVSRRAAWMVEALHRAIRAGLPVDRVRADLASYLSAAPLRIACLECNEDQLYALRIELETLFGVETVGIDVDALDTDGVRNALRGCDLIVTTTSHGADAREHATVSGIPHLVVAWHPDIAMELEQQLRVGPVYFVTTDLRYARKAGEVFRSMDGAENLRPFVLGVDPIDSIPDSAAVHLAGRARERLRDTPLAARARPAGALLSDESARELLAITIGAALREAPRG